ncbi:MAG: single-stranded DNA-binding protein [Parachlamydiaceae bacterium]|nr:single-stranded DNA-binding protein [Parachlamydiaceae bacterium]
MIIVELAGHLGTDPEVRFSPSGQKITTLRIATNIRRQGKEETVWWKAVIFGDHLDKMISYLKKGSAIIVFGKMNPPTIYNDKAGHPQVSLEIVASMIEFNPFGKSDRAGEPGAQSQYGDQRQQPNRPMNLEAPSFAAPSYSSSPTYESPAQFSPPQQPPFVHNTPHSNAPNHQDQFPEEDNLPF